MRIQFLEAKSIASSRERALKKELNTIRRDMKVVPKLGILLVTGDQTSMAQSDKVVRIGEKLGFEITGRRKDNYPSEHSRRSFHQWLRMIHSGGFGL